MTSRLPEEIVPDNDQTRARAEHLARIQELVGNAYPNKFARTSLTESAEGEDTITSVTSALRKHHPLFINTHFNHEKELTPEARAGCDRIVELVGPRGAALERPLRASRLERVDGPRAQHGA